KPLALAPDGKLVLVAGVGDADDPAGTMDSLVIRLNPDGTFDSGFGDGGSVRRSLLLDPHETPRGVTVGPDGKLLVSIGGCDDGFCEAFARLLDDGQLDPSFGAAGIAPIGIAALTDLHVGSNGTITAAGYKSGAEGRVVIARFSAT